MSSIVTAGGLSVHTRALPAAASTTARGTLLIVHGLGDHVGRYANVAAALNAAGWHLVGYDQHGHGRSGGAGGAIASARSLIVDLALAIDFLCTPADSTRIWPERVVLLGDSMGGTVGGRFFAEVLADAPAARSHPVDGLVLVSLMLDVELTPLEKLLLAVLEPLAPSLPVPAGIELDNLLHDLAIARGCRPDPLLHGRITARLARVLFDGVA
jgi:alpha-beta hydrolase superfamily lysophospholipase